MKQNSYEDSNGLYLVPTPIGNLEDMTFRAIKVLSQSDCIYCEDTRTSSKLLSHYSIKTKTRSLHEHNEEERISEIKSALDERKMVSIISDAGMPNICDPGFKVIKSLIDENYKVVSLPGANAFISALAASGLDSSCFTFLGFFEKKDARAKEVLRKVSTMNMTVGFYESPHRINKTLCLIKEELGDINIVISREISKKFETIYRGKISEFMDIKFKGEIVLLLEKINFNEQLPLEKYIEKELDNGLSGKTLVKAIAIKTDYSKNKIYNKYLDIINNDNFE
ncbi:MAG: 16S rRNA (cytidine(1402)-2'-O)-methyltransferase [Bacilli bacterium]